MQRKTSYMDVPAGTQNRFKVLFFFVQHRAI